MLCCKRCRWQDYAFWGHKLITLKLTSSPYSILRCGRSQTLPLSRNRIQGFSGHLFAASRTVRYPRTLNLSSPSSTLLPLLPQNRFSSHPPFVLFITHSSIQCTSSLFVWSVYHPSGINPAFPAPRYYLSLFPIFHITDTEVKHSPTLFLMSDQSLFVIENFIYFLSNSFIAISMFSHDTPSLIHKFIC